MLRRVNPERIGPHANNARPITITCMSQKIFEHLLLETLTRVVGPKYTLHKLASEEATQLLRMLTSHTLAYTCLKSLVLERMPGYEIHVLNERSGVPPRPEVQYGWTLFLVTMLRF